MSDGKCMACGGDVDDDGKAHGIDIGEDEGKDMLPLDHQESDESRQRADSERLRAFAEAVSGGR